MEEESLTAEVMIQDPSDGGEPSAEPTPEAKPEQPQDTPAPEEKTEKQPEPPRSGVQRRIDELTREKWDARREADYWRGLAQTQPPPAAAGAARAVRGEPRETDFDNYNDYVQALTNWKVREAAQTWQRQQEMQRRQVEQLEKTRAVDEKMRAGQAKFTDFMEVATNPAAPISPAMVEAAAAGDAFADVVYHLGKNPAEAARIASLPPIVQAREIGRLEARLAAPPPNRVTNAPPPPTPVKTGAGTGDKDPEKMSFAEYEAWRKKQKT